VWPKTTKADNLSVAQWLKGMMMMIMVVVIEKKKVLK
jgi:hypothetical protein